MSTHRRENRPRRLVAVATLGLLLLSAPSFARGGGGGDDGGGGGNDDKALTLRVNDAIGKPGGTVAVVLRTYAPRPVRQGQVLLRVRRRPPAQRAALTLEALTQPLRAMSSLLSATVYSQRGDAANQAALNGQADGQTVSLSFLSPSGTVNSTDGPLAVLRFKLDPSVAPGQQFDLTLDPAVTSLLDGQGHPVTLDPRGAVLTVRAANAPFALEAEGDKVEPGETAELGVNTYEPFPVSSGQVALRYDRRLAAGPPVVRMDPRYGRATFSVDHSTPGLLVVRFQSPDKSLNTVPGTIVAVDLPTSAALVPGTTGPISLVPELTYLVGTRGKKLKLKLEPGELEVR
jgi:hypothetical protein